MNRDLAGNARLAPGGVRHAAYDEAFPDAVRQQRDADHRKQNQGAAD